MNVVTDDRAVAPASMRFDRDYQVMPHLDRYEAAGLAEDEEEYDQEAELDARLRAESEMQSVIYTRSVDRVDAVARDRERWRRARTSGCVRLEDAAPRIGRRMGRWTTTKNLK